MPPISPVIGWFPFRQARDEIQDGREHAGRGSRRYASGGPRRRDSCRPEVGRSARCTGCGRVPGWSTTPTRTMGTIAPLWELFPWKEAKNYWEELLEGKYESSSMGKLLRKKGLLK